MTPFTGTDLIAETVRMDAALARLLRGMPARAAEPRSEPAWGWLDGGPSSVGLEITEHTLPDGVDFFSFQTLVGELH
jgi:hypothetical protein